MQQQEHEGLKYEEEGEGGKPRGQSGGSSGGGGEAGGVGGGGGDT